MTDPASHFTLVDRYRTRRVDRHFAAATTAQYQYSSAPVRSSLDGTDLCSRGLRRDAQPCSQGVIS